MLLDSKRCAPPSPFPPPSPDMWGTLDYWLMIINVAMKMYWVVVIHSVIKTCFNSQIKVGKGSENKYYWLFLLEEYGSVDNNNIKRLYWLQLSWEKTAVIQILYTSHWNKYILEQFLWWDEPNTILRQCWHCPLNTPGLLILIKLTLWVRSGQVELWWVRYTVAKWTM